MEKEKAIVRQALIWLISVGLIYVGLQAFIKGLWKGAPLIIVGGICLLPPMKALLSKKIGRSIPSFVLAVAGLAVAIAGVGLAGNQEIAKNAQEKQDAINKLQLDFETRREAAQKELRENKLAILARAQKTLEEGDAAGAQKQLARFIQFSDPDVTRLRDSIALVALRKELQSDLTDDRKGVVYQQIARLDPADVQAKMKATEYEEVLKRRRAEEEKNARAQARAESIHRQFSHFDGSHPAVEAAIKQFLKNPASYEHVQTRFADNGGENFTVFTTFRATNSFNAIVTQNATAIVSPDGRVKDLSIY